MKDFTHALEQSLTGAIAARERARARRRRRVAFAVPAFACAAAVAFAALPAADRPSSAPEILRAASAAASEQEGLTGFGGFRYVRQSYRLDRQVLRHVCRTCEPEVIGRVQLEQTREAWVGADWQARSIWREPRKLGGEGDSSDWRDMANPTGEIDQKLVGQPVFDVPLDQLPTEPQGLRRALLDGVKGEDDRTTRIWALMQAADSILGLSNAPADLRGAAYALLAGIEGAEALGETRDSRGRTGQAIRISDSGERRFTFVIDPGSGTLLESIADYGAGPDTTATYEASARVAAIGDRP